MPENSPGEVDEVFDHSRLSIIRESPELIRQAGDQIWADMMEAGFGVHAVTLPPGAKQDPFFTGSSGESLEMETFTKHEVKKHGKIVLSYAHHDFHYSLRVSNSRSRWTKVERS